MEGIVKPDRRHGTAAPQARTRRTRASVVDAARSLFEERGYAATTIEAISERSDTPQATIYRLFASKLGILKAVIDVAIVGDDEDVAMADRPQVRELLADADAHQRLAQFAALLRDLMARTAPVHRLLADAARSDPEAASLLAEIARQRQAGPAARRPIPRPLRAPSARGCGSATPPTSSMRWRPPRSTACSCSTAGGAASATSAGWPTRSASSCSRRAGSGRWRSARAWRRATPGPAAATRAVRWRRAGGRAGRDRRTEPNGQPSLELGQLGAQELLGDELVGFDGGELGHQLVGIVLAEDRRRLW